MIALVVGIAFLTSVIAADTAIHGAGWSLSLFPFFGEFVAIASIPGWVLAIPFVLAVGRVDGPRFWIFLTIGTAIGPFVAFLDELLRALAGGKIGGYNPQSLELEVSTVLEMLALYD